MYYVYILRSINYSKRLYIGCAQNIEQRLIEHNRGSSTYSKTFAPWKLEAYTVFKDQQVAEEFERYLKSGSGHAFLKKRFLPKLLLLSLIGILAATGCAGTVFIRSASHTYLVTPGPLKQADVSVAVQVLKPDETKDVFEVELTRRGIQPLLIKIKNDGAATYRFSKSDVSTRYVPAQTAAKSAYENPIMVGRQIAWRVVSSLPELIFTPQTRSKTPPRPIFNETVRSSFLAEEIPDREIGPNGSLEGFLYVQPLQPDTRLTVTLINVQTQQPLLFEFPLAEERS